jgi:DNA-binding GntR family transcriptional regulator
VTEPVGRPAYQEVADDLRQRIGTGEFPVGAAIPSTAKLTGDYRVSTTVVRAAIAQLRADGVLIGRTGKGVFVRATPAEAAQQAVSVESLSRQVDELRAELRRVKAAQREQVAAGFAELRQQMDQIERRLVDLSNQVGERQPGDGPVESGVKRLHQRKAQDRAPNSG